MHCKSIIKIFSYDEYLIYCAFKDKILDLEREKIRAVRNIVKTMSLKDLQTFIRFIQILSKVMPHLSTVSAPQKSLLEKNTAWHWDEEKEMSFQKLTDMATNTSIHHCYNPRKPLALSVYAI